MVDFTTWRSLIDGAGVIPDGAIYYEAAEVSSTTGGWVKGASNGTHTFSLESDHILTQGTDGNGRVQAETDTEVDLNGVSLIRVEFSMPQRGDGDLSDSEVGIYVSSTAGERIFDVTTADRYTANNSNWPSDYSRTEFTLDVSAITGSRYVGVFGGTPDGNHTGTTEVNTFSVVLD